MERSTLEPGIGEGVSQTGFLQADVGSRVHIIRIQVHHRFIIVFWLNCHIAHHDFSGITGIGRGLRHTELVEHGLCFGYHDTSQTGSHKEVQVKAFVGKAVSPAQVPLGIDTTQLVGFRRFRGYGLAFIVHDVAVLITFQAFFRIYRTHFFSFAQAETSHLDVAQVECLSGHGVLHVRSQFDDFIAVGSSCQRGTV